jgi:hypothetical protein
MSKHVSFDHDVNYKFLDSPILVHLILGSLAQGKNNRMVRRLTA